MKQLIICLLLVISTGLLAQSEKPIEKGQLMLGGAGSFGYLSELSESETSYGQLSFSLDPSVGFFVAHGFALGVSPSVGFTSIFGDNTYHSTTFGLGIFLVKYFDIGIFLRGDFEYGYSLNKYESYYGPETTKYHSAAFIPAVGYAFFLGPNVALEIAINNSFNLGFRPEESSTFNIRSYFSAGFQIFL